MLKMLSMILLIGVSAVDPQCLYEIQQEVSAIPSILSGNQTVYTEMASSSGLKLNDLGNYKKCNDISIARYVYFPFGANIGFSLCAPKSCSKQDLAEILSGNITQQALTADIKDSIIFPKEIYDDECTSLTSGAIVMVLFIFFVGFIAIVATAIEIATVPFFREAVGLKKTTDLDSGPKTQKSLALQALLCFSLYSNTKKLFDSRSAERLGKKDTMDILNGVRVMSIGWVILGHVALQYFGTQVLSNYEDIPDFLKQFNKTIIFAALFAVDTFFWLSGLLMAFLFLKEIDRPVAMSPQKWTLVYVHRFLRITPLVLFSLLFWWSMQAYLGNGPLWYKYNTINGECEKYWWTVVTYLNNFIPDGKANSCLGVTWYLANDMQFFLISPLVLFVYHKQKIAGWALILLLNVVSMLSSGVIAYHYGLNPALFAAQNGINFGDYYYVKPYTRVGAYALGLAVGMILYSFREYKNTGRVYDSISIQIAKLYSIDYIRYLLAFLGLVLVTVFVFVQYDIYGYAGDNFEYKHWNEDQNITFITFYRTGFILGLSLFLLPCLFGYFPLVSVLLGASVWTPLARLTFAVYLFHYNIIYTVYLNQNTQIYMDQFYVIRDTAFFTVMSFIVAIPVVLLIESPCINLEKLLLRRSPGPKRVEKETEESAIEGDAINTTPLIK